MKGASAGGQGIALLLALLLGGTATSAEARGRDDEDDEEQEDEEDDEGDEDEDPEEEDDEEEPERERSGGFKVDDGDIDREGDGDTDDDGDEDELVSEFEKDLFFVDKIDDRETIDQTLLQGSFTSSSFFYRESGGALPGNAGVEGVTSASRVTRLFTDLRAQLAARHLGGGNWDVRLDGRVRLTADPSNATVIGDADNFDFDVKSQSGALGRNEYDLRELTLARIGEKTTFVLGRQIVPELAATRVDGARLTLIRSEKLSLLGFAGLLPVRGSRSIGFDYPRVSDANGDPARLLPMGGGLGAAYSVPKAYGSFGAVVEAAGQGEPLRALLTSAGYFRSSPQLDAYHYAVIDVIGAAGFALTNLSLGIDYRPRPRIRLAAQVNHVDTETLDIVARKLLSDRDATGVVRNDVAIYRIASNEGRGAASVALGQLEQMEVSTALTVRQRGQVPLTDGTEVLETLPAAQSLEVWGQFVHRRLVGSRVGVDVSKILGIGEATFARSSVLSLRAFAAREFMKGKAEAEVMIGYASAEDKAGGTSCATVVECFGASKTSTLGLTVTGYYRLSNSIFGLAMLDVNRMSGAVTTGGMTVSDPGTLGLAGYLRLAYRY